MSQSRVKVDPVHEGSTDSVWGLMTQIIFLGLTSFCMGQVRQDNLRN